MGTGNLCFLCNSTKSRSYHRFPKYPVLRSIWKKICGLEPSDNVDSLRICSNHFIVSDYTDRNGPRCRFRKNVYPTVNVKAPLLPRYNPSGTSGIPGLTKIDDELTPSIIEQILRKSEEPKCNLLSLDSTLTPLNCIGEPSICNHSGEHLCEHCGILYTQAYHPQPKTSPIITRLIAEEKKKYRCRFCSKKFKVIGYLMRHERNHTFNSEVYEKFFLRRAKRNYEPQIVRTKKVPRKKFRCHSCPEAFNVLRKLRIHEKFHHSTDNIDPFYQKILYKEFVFTDTF
ncbi:uncharacterized protein [Leptinotarsa decemlineata]|uniref:uncharacterized protein n=1 Tax=Leptinotarsa decemlineata TaxID=7539 RepID=UPI003D30B1E9